MSRHARQLLLVSALLASAPLGAEVIVEAAAPGQPRSVRFELGERPDPCVTWNVQPFSGSTLWVAGHPAAACPSEPQAVQLPGLEAGSYTLVTYLSASGEIWEKARFTVGVPPPPFGVFVDLLPETPSPQEPLEIAVSTVNYGLNHSLFFPDPPSIDGDRIVFEGEAVFCPITCPAPALVDFRGNRFVLPPLAPGMKVIELRVDGFLYGERAFTVGGPATALTLHDGRFEVRLEWRDHGGQLHAASAETLTAESGRFWFFGRENVELTVKILDGRAINGAFWLFAASMTDLAYTLTVTDRNTAFCAPQEPCPRVEVYQGPAGENHNVIDNWLFTLLPPS